MTICENLLLETRFESRAFHIYFGDPRKLRVALEYRQTKEQAINDSCLPIARVLESTTTRIARGFYIKLEKLPILLTGGVRRALDPPLLGESWP